VKTLIGKGKTSEVYVEHDLAYKHYDENRPISYIEEELRINRVISTLTKLPMSPLLPTSDPYVIQMKYLGNETMTHRMLNRQPNVIEDLIDLQLSVFQYRDLPLLNIHDRYQRRISSGTNLSDQEKLTALSILNDLPFQTTLAHMDFHPSNILFYEDKYWIIDWVNAGLANPLLCVARTYILLHYHALRRSQKYLTVLSKRTGWTKETIRTTAIIQAADRILESDDADEIACMQNYIKEVVAYEK
jgi:thiamine kinase-like enzyme